MRILHVVPGLAEKSNGIAVAARLIAEGQRKAGHEVDVAETRDFAANVQPSAVGLQPLSAYAEIWVHSNWWPPTLRACRKVIRAKVPLVRMTHANLDPLRYRSKFLKKFAVSPFERWLYRRSARVVVTCEAERKWCEDWGVRCPIEVIDLKQFFTFDRTGCGRKRDEIAARKDGVPLHILYLGRRHPLKGTKYLEEAVRQIEGVELRMVSDHTGEELERDWEWCDVFCLPTLSDNFGLVVAEALERGKRVITTDGAPAWESEEVRSKSEEVRSKGEEVRSESEEVRSEEGVDSGEGGGQWWGSLIYLKGFRDGDDATRVKLLKEALGRVR